MHRLIINENIAASGYILNLNSSNVVRVISEFHNNRTLGASEI